jgi:hypothetical protein
LIEYFVTGIPIKSDYINFPQRAPRKAQINGRADNTASDIGALKGGSRGWLRKITEIAKGTPQSLHPT